MSQLLEELDPEVEWHAVLPMLGGDAVYHGHEGVREFLGRTAIPTRPS